MDKVKIAVKVALCSVAAALILIVVWKNRQPETLDLLLFKIEDCPLAILLFISLFIGFGLGFLAGRLRRKAK